MILFIFGGSTIVLLAIYLILAFVKYRKQKLAEQQKNQEEGVDNLQKDYE
jgi:hypothetical protein